MSRIHVCLVSDQTMPNILGIYHFRPDELLFITTEKMEQKEKVSAIIKTLDKLKLEYGDRASKIIVQEDSILDCHRKIDDWIGGREDSEFVVNLTGGTKIMSIAAYEYFKDFTSKMIYIPIPKNEFIAPFPKKRPSKPERLDLRVSVVQYLTAYGLNVLNEKKLKRYMQEANKREDLSRWIVANYNEIKNLLVWLSGKLRKHRDDKSMVFSETFLGASKKEITLLDKMGFSRKGNSTSKELARSEIRYLTGGWLEEFCFNEVSKFFGKGIDDAVIGLKMLNPQGRDNEFDIMFTKDNALYFVECKSLDQFDDKNTDILYKIGALQKEFGLRIKSFLVTTSPYILKDNSLRPSVRARAEQFNTQVIPPSEVIHFWKFLAQALKLHTDG